MRRVVCTGKWSAVIFHKVSSLIFGFSSLTGILAVSAILLIAMGILVTMFFAQLIDNFIYKVRKKTVCDNESWVKVL